MRQVLLNDMTWPMLVWVYLIEVRKLRTAKRQGKWEYVPAPERHFTKHLLTPGEFPFTVTFDTFVCDARGNIPWVWQLIHEHRVELRPLDRALHDVHWDDPDNDQPKGWSAARGNAAAVHHTPEAAVVLLAIREALPDAIDYPIPDELCP